ncbi:hypothetical protein WJX81_005278 [Elliptochloris bilobata]|uniref:Uncharacterized protein n=1 Tax=Elliptochloris bilobata TaxID=381761 RepID=A0AAW1QKP0_9CHLO
MAPKRKSAANGEAVEDGLESELRRARVDNTGAHAPSLAQDSRLLHRHDAPSGVINVSRAAALIAWVCAVAQRQGYSRTAGLSFGKAVAAMLALKERTAPGCVGRDPALRRQREVLLNIRLADVFGMQVKAVEYGKGDVRAVEGCQAIDAAKVDEYLARAFDGRLKDAEAAFAELANAYASGEIGVEAYRLFQEFRPTPEQVGAGRARKGDLRLERLRELAADAPLKRRSSLADAWKL